MLLTFYLGECDVQIVNMGNAFDFVELLKDCYLG